MTVHQRQNIPITEDWVRSSWSNFDADQQLTTTTALGLQPDLNSGLPFSIGGQNHVTVRTFVETEGWINDVPFIVPLPDPSRYPSPSLLPGGTVVFTGSLPDLNHWPGALLDLPVGTGTMTSSTRALDLTVLGDQARLVLALPGFPLASIDLANTFLDLSSDGFDTEICSLPWSASTTSLIAGNSTLTFPYSALTGCDLAAVTDVRLRITVTTAPCIVTCLALRLIGPDWVQTNVDYDSLNGQLRQCIPLTGDTSLVPVPANKVLPPLWRSAATPGNTDDPRPIDAEVGYLLHTGSNTQQNFITIYMRETSKVVLTQSQLQGRTQRQMTGQPQTNLSLNAPVTDQWVKFVLGWGLHTSAHITSADYPTTGYQYDNPFSLAANTTYFVTCNITDTTVRMEMYNVDQTYLTLGTRLFDTTVINDSFTFVRRSGRIGFQADIRDGDAYLGPIRPRSLMFAEYRSAPLQSITPVRGARLYVQTTPEVNLFQQWSPLADSDSQEPLLDIDQQRYVQAHSDHQSTKVTVITPSTTDPVQGIITDPLTPPGDSISGITDFSSLHVEFNLWMPSAAIRAPLVGSAVISSPPLAAALISEVGAELPINLPVFTGDQWQAISIFQPFAKPYPRSGLYRLVLYYLSSIPAVFWIDGVQLHQHPIDWDARSVTDDPWHSNYAPWTPFHDTTNDDNGGVLFTTQGASLQVRGLARTADSIILSPLKIVPQYAELGRLVWPEDKLVGLQGPTVVLTASNTGRTYTFRGTSSSSAQQIGNWLWAFGDGAAGSGPVVTHTYDSTWPAGTALTVTLTVVDRMGLSATTSTIITF